MRLTLTKLFLPIIVLALISFLLFVNSDKMQTTNKQEFYNVPTEFIRNNIPARTMREGTRITSTAQFIVASIASYYRDPRLTDDVIADKLPLAWPNPDPQNPIPLEQEKYTPPELFLEGYGYETKNFVYKSTEYQLYTNHIKHVLLDENNIVIVHPIIHEDSLFKQHVTRRIITGYSDETQEWYMHDNRLGNNYVMSYERFKELSAPELKITVVSPSTSLIAQNTIQGADPDYIQPERLSIMDDLDLQALSVIVHDIGIIDSLGKSSEQRLLRKLLLQNMFDSPGFTKLHPAAQIQHGLELYREYIPNKEWDKAKIVLETIVPHTRISLMEDANGWERNFEVEDYDNSWYLVPNIVLADTYNKLSLVDQEQAIRAYLVDNFDTDLINEEMDRFRQLTMPRF